MLLSDPIWDEYTTVAEWLIPSEKKSEKKRIITELHAHAIWVEPIIQLHVCTDPADNRFLECAVAGHADYLVTKNIRHFPYKTYEKIKIVRIRDFFRVLESMTGS